jgi:hypothetical protein
MTSEGFQSIKIAVDDRGNLVCARCFAKTKLSQVAAFTRTMPIDPFEPWCHDCFSVLAHAAKVGLELAETLLSS